MLKNDLHLAASIVENETYKILSNFEIQPDHIIQVRRQDLLSINKKNLLSRKFFGSSWPPGENIRKQKMWTNNQRVEDVVEGGVAHDTNCRWRFWNSSQNMKKDIVWTMDQSTKRDYSTI